MSKTHPVGSLEHAMAYAVQSLGMETVARICDRSASAIYRGINPDDPLKLSWLTVAQAEALGQALLIRNKPEFFSSALHQRIEQEAFPGGHGAETLENPIMLMAEASEQLSRALRLIAVSTGRSGEIKNLSEEEALMIAEALAGVINYARRAKLTALKRVGNKPGQLNAPES